ncbi:unnamed protein product [Strongylus vulgaris]|uniref:ZP domain-containing protein n=1 Tax=Strongylus vulgaris TaxID=40348 RepID=A0A3P7LUJ8_STRVU|nr:unnamed protein product [Strongylus vulgaris]
MAKSNRCLKKSPRESSKGKFEKPACGRNLGSPQRGFDTCISPRSLIQLYFTPKKCLRRRCENQGESDELLTFETPHYRYEILSEDPNGVPIKYGKIGETVYHKWACFSELTDVYCLRVHSCTIYDGQGGPPVTVLDANGCSVDGVILQNLDYTSDLTDGKLAQEYQQPQKHIVLWKQNICAKKEKSIYWSHRLVYRTFKPMNLGTFKNSAFRGSEKVPLEAGDFGRMV